MDNILGKLFDSGNGRVFETLQKVLNELEIADRYEILLNTIMLILSDQKVEDTPKNDKKPATQHYKKRNPETYCIYNLPATYSRKTSAWAVQIKPKKIYKIFKTLEEAKIYRDKCFETE